MGCCGIVTRNPTANTPQEKPKTQSTQTDPISRQSLLSKPLKRLLSDHQTTHYSVTHSSATTKPSLRTTLQRRSFDDGGLYAGEMSGTSRHGHGIYKFPDGTRYEGGWLQDRAHGLGTLYHTSGDLFHG